MNLANSMHLIDEDLRISFFFVTFAHKENLDSHL